MFFRALENAARLFFNLSDFVFASLVKFFFLYNMILHQSFTYPTYAAIVYEPF